MNVTERGRDGFTLVELLIVLVVIGLVTAVAVPTRLRALNRSRQARAMEDMKDRSTTLAIKVGLSGRYPEELPLGGRPSREDPWGNESVYRVTDDGDSFTLRCLGRDGKASAGISAETRDEFDLDIVMEDGIFIHEPFSR